MLHSRGNQFSALAGQGMKRCETDPAKWSMSELRAAENTVRRVREKVAIDGPNASLLRIS
jgi:hypothetical protein